MSDTDVEIVDIVLEHYQRKILENYDEEVDKGEINTRLIFEDANLVTIWKCERSTASEPGCAGQTLSLCIDELKRRFKRNVRIAALIEPYQYNRDSAILQSVSLQREEDVKKISLSLAKLRSHPNVLGVFLKGNSSKYPDTTFTQYCGAAYFGSD